ESPETQALILDHEQRHLNARDPLLWGVSMLLVALVPWNLPLWWQLRRLRLAMELDCDARVLSGGAEPLRYGQVLLAVTRQATSVPMGALTMSEPVSALERRIRLLAPVMRTHLPAKVAAALTLVVAGFGGALALEAPAISGGSATSLPPIDMSIALSSRTGPVDDRPLRTVLERYPEIAQGTVREGVYVVAMALNADGRVHRSQMRLAPEGDQRLVQEELLELLPAEVALATEWPKGSRIPGGGQLRHDLEVHTVYLPD